MSAKSSDSPTESSNRYTVTRIALGILVLLALALAFVITTQKRQISLLESRLKVAEVERTALANTLELETVVGQHSIALLRNILSGGETDAIAVFSADNDSGFSAEAVVIWSDQYRTGQWIWLSDPVPNLDSELIRFETKLADAEGFTALETIVSPDRRVIGLSSPHDSAPPRSLRAIFPQERGADNPTELRAEFVR